MDISRRKFFLLGAAATSSAIIHTIIPNKVIFDLGIARRINPSFAYGDPLLDEYLPALEELNKATIRYIIPALTDEFFKPSPTYWRLTKGAKCQTRRTS